MTTTDQGTIMPCSEVPSIRSDRQIPDTTTSNLDEKQRSLTQLKDLTAAVV
jgi:hypothetical protein